MNEVTGRLAPETPVGGESPRKPSAGELLRQAREDGGLHIAALAVALKVSVKKLEALEADRFDLLPDAVFVRAMASSVCRALKIDPTPVLDQLPQTAVPRLEFDGCGLNTPFQTPGDVSRVSIWNQLSRPVVLTALTLLVGALVLIFFPSMDHADAPAATTSEVVEPSSVAAPVTPAMPAVAQAEQAAPVRQPPEPAIPAKPAPVTATATATATAVQPAAVAGSVTSAPVKVKVSSTGIIVFKTRGESWVEVTDARGVVQISRMIGVGEVVGVSGPLPLSVAVGRADITDVQVRGKPFPLDELTKGTVAHFEVK
jgi:cytoskeleton protein RodZ